MHKLSCTLFNLCQILTQVHQVKPGGCWWPGWWNWWRHCWHCCRWIFKSIKVDQLADFKGAAVGSLAGQLAERGVNHLIEDKDVQSDLGSLADLAENPARELVKTAGVTALDGALGALGGKMDAGADKVIMATANKRMTRAVAKGSTTAVKKVVKSGLKIAGKKATDVLAEEAGNLADKDANNVLTAIKQISQLPMEVARQQTEKVPTLKFLASQVPRRRIMPEEDEEEEEVENLCGAFVEISFQNLEDTTLAASPPLKC